VTNHDIMTMVARERQNTLLAQAQAARQAKQARAHSAAPTSRLLRVLHPSRRRHAPVGRAVTQSPS
jgi:hypothetical protein